MRITNQIVWDSYVEKNKDDPYGARCVSYAEDWADLMETELATGSKLETIAKETGRQANTDGITGFMCGCAVEMLAQCWEYGEQLRIWHNLDTQIREEGQRANKSGGVLNPACLIIPEKKEEEG